MKWSGIDVSGHNGKINWSDVKETDTKFAILKATEGTTYTSYEFESNYNACKKNNIPVGAYHFLLATNVNDAKKEAQYFMSKLKGKQFEMPVYLDIETDKQSKLSKNICTQMVDTFCSELEKNGYFVGVYSFDSFFYNNLDKNIQNKYSCWVANVSTQPKFVAKYDIWQYSWTGSVRGVPTLGKLDMNYCYRDFPSIIIKNGLNGFSKNSNNISDNQVFINKAYSKGYISDKNYWKSVLDGNVKADKDYILELFRNICK